MDLEDQNELRRKRMRIFDNTQPTQDHTSSLSNMGLIDDAIMARRLEGSLDKISPMSSRADDAPTHPQQSHPGDQEVRAAYANGEYSELFTLLCDFDEKSKHNTPPSSKKPSELSAVPRHMQRKRRGNGTGYGGDTDEYGYDYDESDSDFDQATSFFGGQGHVLGGTPSTTEPKLPTSSMDDLTPKKMKKPVSMKTSKGFLNSTASWSPFGKMQQKLNSLPLNNFTGKGNSLTSDQKDLQSAFSPINAPPLPPPATAPPGMFQPLHPPPSSALSGLFASPNVPPHQPLSYPPLKHPKEFAALPGLPDSIPAAALRSDPYSLPSFDQYGQPLPQQPLPEQPTPQQPLPQQPTPQQALAHDIALLNKKSTVYKSLTPDGTVSISSEPVSNASEKFLYGNYDAKKKDFDWIFPKPAAYKSLTPDGIGSISSKPVTDDSDNVTHGNFDPLGWTHPKMPPPTQLNNDYKTLNALWKAPAASTDHVDDIFGTSFGMKKKLELKLEEPIKPDGDDVMTTRVFGRLAELLDTYNGDAMGVSDADIFDPSVVFASIVRCSTILDRAADLLRHSTLEEITCKPDLFQKLHDFVDRLAKESRTAFLVREHRIAHKPGHSLAKLAQNLQTAGISDLSASSLLCCMKPLAKIAGDGLSDPDVDAGIVCLLRDIINTYKRLASDETSSEGRAEPFAWQSEFRYAQVPDDIIMAEHSRPKAVKKVATSDHFPGRMKRILKEIIDLRDNLPDGIFVRCADSRPDMMKILIIGPKDTPYENGLFEFDLLYPSDFPMSPPAMQFKTTGGGRVRMNPNLYADGKVCLSILGTWAGTPWDPNTSTTRQVLVSIQAMILCATPWKNEPGRDVVSDNDRQVQEYNQYLQPMTVKYAMLSWLEGKKSEVWGEVVEKHFSEKEQEIISCVDAWAAVPRLQKELFKGTGWAGKKLEGEEVLVGLLPRLQAVLPALLAKSEGHGHEVFEDF